MKHIIQIVSVFHEFVGHSIFLYNPFPDVNECAKNNGGCSQECTNLPGRFHCYCTPGYRLLGDNRTCEGMCFFAYAVILLFEFSLCTYVDIDECKENVTCSDICVNELGTYHCECLDGFSLSDDGHLCSGKGTILPRRLSASCYVCFSDSTAVSFVANSSCQRGTAVP